MAHLGPSFFCAYFSATSTPARSCEKQQSCWISVGLRDAGLQVQLCDETVCSVNAAKQLALVILECECRPSLGTSCSCVLPSVLLSGASLPRKKEGSKRKWRALGLVRQPRRSGGQDGEISKITLLCQHTTIIMILK